MSCGDLFLGLLAIMFPPIAVWIKRGLCSADSFINILLCILGYLPGVIHSWYIIARYPEPGYDTVPDEERVTYYYVSRDGVPVQPPGPGVAGQPDGGRAHRELQRGGSGYGTMHQSYREQAAQNIGASGSEGGQAAGQVAGAGPSPAAGRSSGETPPTYAEAVKGDNKMQTP